MAQLAFLDTLSQVKVIVVEVKVIDNNDDDDDCHNYHHLLLFILIVDINVNSSSKNS